MQNSRNEGELLRAFSPELRLLMALVGQSVGLASDAPLPHGSPEDWARLPELAANHRVQPLVWAALRAAPDLAPPDVRRRAQSEAQQAWIHSTLLAQELAQISRLLTDHGIALAAMKGPALAAQVYGAATSRAMIDLDILIRPADLAQTRALLEGRGFAWEESVAHLPSASQEVFIRQAQHFAFRHRRLGYPLEVHVRASSGPDYFPVPAARLLAASEPVSVAGVAVPTLAPQHHFLFVAAHGAKHGWWRLQWVADFAAFFPRFPEWFSGERGLMETARALGLSRVLDAAFALSALCFGTPRPYGAGAGASGPLIAHGRRSLARGRQPETLRESGGQMLQFLRLRADPAYLCDVFRIWSQVTPDDLARFPLPLSLSGLYPALRPWLWFVRKAVRERRQRSVD